MDRSRAHCEMGLLGLAVLTLVGGVQAQPAGTMSESERYIAIRSLALGDAPNLALARQVLNEAGLDDVEASLVEGVVSKDTTVFRLRSNSGQALALERLKTIEQGHSNAGSVRLQLSVLPSHYTDLFGYRISPLQGLEAIAVANLRTEIERTFNAKKSHVVAATPSDAVLTQLLRVRSDGLTDTGGTDVAFDNGHPTIELDLQFDGLRRFRATHAEPLADGSVAMEGTMLDANGNPSGLGALVAGPNGVQGSFHIDGRIFDLRPVARSAVALPDLIMPQTSLLSEAPVVSPFSDHTDWSIDAALADAGHPVADAGPMPDAAPLPDAAASQEHVVDLIVAVTPAAKRSMERIGRPVSVAMPIEIGIVNGYSANQRMGMRLRLVENGVVDVEYAEATCSVDCSAATEVRDLLAFSEGHEFQGFRDLRRKSRADVAVLVLDIFQRAGKASPCGLASSLSATEPKQGMLIVDFACLNMTMNFTLMHELGHLLGANHNTGAPLPLNAQPGSLGFVSPDANWRDVMSYPDACGACQRKPFFSSKDECLFLDPNNSNQCVSIGNTASNVIPAMRAHVPRLSRIAEVAWPTP